MSRYLIVNADDYGLSAGVSRGILEGYRRGVITSTTAMITMPGAVDAVRDAAQSAPDLGLGLHLTLAGYACPPALPPAEVRSLLRADGYFYDQPEWSQRHDTFDSGEIARELAAQVELFVRAAGRPPDHLDSHYHAAYLHAGGLEALFDLAERYRIPVRNPGIDPARLDDSVRAMVGEGWYAPIRAVFDAKAIPAWPARIAGVGEKGMPDDVSRVLAALPPDDGLVTELVAHPGYAHDLSGLDSYTTGREAELRLLLDPQTRAAIEAQGFTLCRFDVLAG